MALVFLPPSYYTAFTKMCKTYISYIIHIILTWTEGVLMAIPYDYYRIFYYVAKCRSFTHAAKVLMNSQPNITRTINNLEAELGCRLFLRSRSGVVLTPEGERLFAHVKVAQEHLQAGEAEIADAKNLLSGHLSIGASEIALHSLLLPVLRDFHQAYPGIHIQVSNHSTPQAVAAVKSGLADLAVVTTPTEVHLPLKELSLLPFQDILIAGPGFSELRGKPITLGALKNYPLVALGRAATTAFYDRFFSAHGQVLQPAIEVATTDQILPLVRYDLGLGFLPASFAVEAIARGEVFEVSLEEPIPARFVCLVWDKSRPLSAPAEQLKTLICRAAGLSDSAE